MPAKRLSVAIVAVLVVAGTVGAVVKTLHRRDGLGLSSAAPAVDGKAPEGFVDQGSGATGGGGSVSGSTRDSSLALAGPKIVKTASLTLRLPGDSFKDRFARASEVASRFGGFVSSSSTNEAAKNSGTIVIRVPSSSFQAALAGLRGLGTVKAEEISGQDVTAEFVDLEARLRNWEAQETVLLRLMDRAKSISDSVKVQRELSQVQQNIEELRGQLRYLNDQTDLATITVAMSEAGTTHARPASSIARAWHEALDGFVAVIAAVITGLGYVIPIGLLLAFALLIRRKFRSRPAPVKA